jgi:hypothetical protein
MRKKRKNERYVVGTPNAPKWCKNRIMPYLRYDGKTGYEFFGLERTFIMEAGDVLTWDGYRIGMIRRRMMQVGAGEDILDAASKAQ